MMTRAEIIREIDLEIAFLQGRLADATNRGDQRTIVQINRTIAALVKAIAFVRGGQEVHS
jgi:hypothetical protein